MYYEKVNPKVWDDDIWLKHVHQEGSRKHVIYWTSKGRHCNERDCIMNAPDEVMTRATKEGKPIHIFIETQHKDAYALKTVTIIKIIYI